MGGVGVGGEAEVAEVVENQQVLLVMREGLHQRRGAEVVFGAAIDVPRRRVDAVRFEQGHEADRWFDLAGQALGVGAAFHQIEEGQGQHGPRAAAEEGPSIDLPGSHLG